MSACIGLQIQDRGLIAGQTDPGLGLFNPAAGERLRARIHADDDVTTTRTTRVTTNGNGFLRLPDQAAIDGLTLQIHDNQSISARTARPAGTTRTTDTVAAGTSTIAPGTTGATRTRRGHGILGLCHRAPAGDLTFGRLDDNGRPAMAPRTTITASPGHAQVTGVSTMATGTTGTPRTRYRQRLLGLCHRASAGHLPVGRLDNDGRTTVAPGTPGATRPANAFPTGVTTGTTGTARTLIGRDRRPVLGLCHRAPVGDLTFYRLGNNGRFAITPGTPGTTRPADAVLAGVATSTTGTARTVVGRDRHPVLGLCHRAPVGDLTFYRLGNNGRFAITPGTPGTTRPADAEATGITAITPDAARTLTGRDRHRLLKLRDRTLLNDIC
ncbi:hypothetical protein [Thioalkalivibrio thiocyanodenitrificans]|uniref:hypothetical protein n=1 Tax=Thioalkalivibrio thiocyanodenitrificans TaxID=243063 RepID=UPI00039F5792|nr:hypothetical protein [Thioalkalivibrio thiocyanodenitrificans]